MTVNSIAHLVRFYKSVLREYQWVLTPSIETIIKETVIVLEEVEKDRAGIKE